MSRGKGRRINCLLPRIERFWNWEILKFPNFKIPKFYKVFATSIAFNCEIVSLGSFD